LTAITDELELILTENQVAGTTILLSDKEPVDSPAKCEVAYRLFLIFRLNNTSRGDHPGIELLHHNFICNSRNNG
jgi:hypothetical protein